MNEMLERVAGAIMTVSDDGDCAVQDWIGQAEDNPRVAQAVRQARVAIEAMRKISLEMHRAGNRSLDDFEMTQECARGQVIDLRSNICWEAMIDAALGDSPDGCQT